MTIDQNDPAPTERGLTPADLHHVQFTRASMMRPGYVESEVDRVLARVAEELGRLYAEKAALRDQVRSLQAQVEGIVIPEAPS
jgi:DivIVA domain-containing protein